MTDEMTKKIRKLVAKAIERREQLKKALNVQTGKIVEGMAAPRVFARFPHLKDQLRPGINAKPLLMLVDLSPFSVIAAKLSATEIAGFLDAYYATVVDVVETVGGVAEKYIGDAVLALFGQPFAENTTTGMLFEVVEMAKKLIRDADKWFGGEASAKVALAWGRCFLGYVGPKEHQELTVVGNPLTTIFRLEAECEPNEIIALEELLDQRPEESMATIAGSNPTWFPKTRSLSLRGVSPDPVTVKTLTWSGGQ